jgi:hypothetical protein
MDRTERQNDEAAAVARVATAAREVQSASEALEEQFASGTDSPSRTLLLARLTAAMSELQAARNALEGLLVRRP